MPGVKPGQVYTYPAKRWVKRRRQYLNYFMQPKKFALEECELSIASVQNPTFTEDSVNSVNETSKVRLAGEGGRAAVTHEVFICGW